MQCYESEKLAEHAIDSDFDHTSVAVPALYLKIRKYKFLSTKCPLGKHAV